ncbi:L,D-transpeptidase family protein [Microbulbifer pacificus]|uniref:L,D-transpeptidase family protein n=1 Tax=Microbulbifer pacificus TaxID=407164 RepID=A0AAU0MXC7_9GAMM|nr:L,D-transpeptidase family protein [Microbulbifer pacificus]WOX04453.1 L,D-transpeptidase family protein [Microbulbifer pacificus]
MHHKTLRHRNCSALHGTLGSYALHFSVIAALGCCALLPLMESAQGATPVNPSDVVEGTTTTPSQPEKKPAKQPEEETGLAAHASEIVDDPDIAVDAETDTDSDAAAKEEDTPESKKTDADKAATDKAGTKDAAANNKQSEPEPPPKPETAPKPTPAPAPSTAAASEPDAPIPDKDRAIDFATAGNALRTQAARYRTLTNHWQAIAPGATLKPGDRSPRVAQLRKILQQYGDYIGPPGPLKASDSDHQRFDAGLQLAVESYQRRHGMEVTGRVNKATLRELARPPQELARLLELNAERWDKLPSAPGNRYIFVNVPDYQLQLVDQRKVVLSMKTVVGKSSKRTPEMTTKVVSVVFNPTWTVPRSILLTDLLPKARNNPEAMHKRGYRVVKYGTNTTTPISEKSIESAASGEATLRQISGPGNTLGRVKFVIPNKQSIFLHDTQAQSLFEQHHRAYSHGCIRLQQPEELAYALLGPQGWDRTQVAQATVGDESVTIKVDNPPRLFITYLTAWVDALGRVQFRPDIYHRDQREL